MAQIRSPSIPPNETIWSCSASIRKARSGVWLIEPTSDHGHAISACAASGKPNRMLAQVLQLRGCLWNSFVMVAWCKRWLDIESAIPELYRPPR
jgi:hypothetical protein